MLRLRSAFGRLGLAFLLALGIVGGREARANESIPTGWHVRYTQKMGVFEDVYDHIAPAAAFVLEETEAPHPMLRAIGWTASYRSRIAFPQPGTYRLGLEVEGGRAELVLRDPGKSVSIATCKTETSGRVETQWVKLDGAKDVEVTFHRAGRGRAKLRAMWEMAPEEFGGFRIEPIPSYVVSITHDPQLVADATRGLTSERGRMLLAKKGCTQCHGPGERDGASIGMRRAPILDSTSRYSSTEWIARWIRDPSAIRAHADMPSLVSSEADAEGTALDLAHYIKSFARDPAPQANWEPSIGPGRKLFHQLGCVACHGALASPREVFDDPQMSSEIPTAPVPHPYGDLAGKWTRGGLAEFLREPTRLHPDGRMPNFDLNESDSRALADFLIAKFGRARDEDATEPPVDTTRTERGAGSYFRLRCDACHGGILQDFVRSGPVAKSLADIAASGEKGCLAATDAGPARYSFEANARAELLDAVGSSTSLSGIAAPVDRMRQFMLGADCFACHRKDTRFGVDPALSIYFHSRDDRVDLGDEGRLPPDLTSVGFKLHTPWMKQVLVGKGIARDYLGVRMPSFATLAPAVIANGLAIEMGTLPESDSTAPVTTDSMVQHGRTLVGAAGMNCIGCHQYKDDPAVGSPGPKIDEFASRLRYEWWTAYIQQPARFKPGTRMPSFAFGRKSTLPTILDGDIYAQGDALWAYFTLGSDMPPPEGIAGKDALKLVVGATPRVLRTFLDRTGSRAIAVGLPVGLHYAFDAENVRLVELWQGDFLDASGAWAGRGGTVCEGQGRLLWTAAPGPALLPLGTPLEKWPDSGGRAQGLRFLGYRFDAVDAPPTFRYAVGDAIVTERIDGKIAPRATATRRFRFEGPVTSPLILRAGEKSSPPLEVSGFDVTPLQIGDSNCFELMPQAGASSYRFDLEVTP